jgi:hypothetical protein
MVMEIRETCGSDQRSTIQAVQQGRTKSPILPRLISTDAARATYRLPRARFSSASVSASAISMACTGAMTAPVSGQEWNSSSP